MGRKGNFLDSANKAVNNVVKGAGWAVEHPDKAISGAAKVGEYAISHPGEVGKIALKEGVKSLTDPKELAINLALAAATMGTGLVAKEAATVGAKTAVEVGTKVAAKTTEEVAAKTAAKVGEETVAKTAAHAAEETAAKSAAKVGEESVAKAAGRTTEQKLLETGRRGPAKWLNEARTGAAQKFLAAGGENPSLLRQAGAGLIQGSSGTMPKQLEGMSDVVHGLQKTAWRGKQINTRMGQVKALGTGVDAAAHPGQTALNLASKHPSGQSSAAGSAEEPVSQPGTGLQPLSQPVNNTYSPGRGFGTPQPARGAYGGGGGAAPPEPPGGTSSGAYGGIPPGGRGANQGMPTSSPAASSGSNAPPPSSPAGPSQSAAYRAGRGFGSNITGPVQRSKVGSYLGSQQIMQSGSGQRFWQGPHREMFGGIDPNYDWRKGYENRPDTPYKTRLRRTGETEEGEGKQPGAYDAPSGQQPQGALNPGAPKMTQLGTGSYGALNSGPRVNKMAAPGAVGRKSSFYQATTRPVMQPMGALGTGKQNSNVIDVDSWEDAADTQYDPGGFKGNQSYLNFPDMPSQPPKKR